MRLLQPVIWTKGTFLSPQHLQAQDRFLEELLQFRTESLHFRPWGFQRLELDREALGGGNVSISAASGLFPDGLAFDIPGSDTAPPPKMILPFFTGDTHELDLYLAIPPAVEGGMNIFGGGRNAETRYMSDVVLLRDENTGLSERPIQVARKNLRLLVDEEAREGTPALRIARVMKTPSGLLEFDPSFAPPLIDLHASSLLAGIARRLLEILVAKSESLSGTRRQKNQSLAEFTAGDIASFWLLYTVNTHLPALRHVVESRHSHPAALFSMMNNLAGSLTTFSSEIRPHQLAGYDHNNLGPCFTALDEQLRNLLETVVPSYSISLPLKRTQASVYATALDDERLLQNTRMFLAIKAAVTESDIISRTPQLVKICSATHIDHLIRQALPGVPLRHVPNPPSGIPLKLDYQYFSLSQTGGAWESILRSHNLAAYVPVELPDPALELVILLPQQQ
jgi:type VI secretion system protein ImpJ